MAPYNPVMKPLPAWVFEHVKAEMYEPEQEEGLVTLLEDFRIMSRELPDPSPLPEFVCKAMNGWYAELQEDSADFPDAELRDELQQYGRRSEKARRMYKRMTRHDAYEHNYVYKKGETPAEVHAAAGKALVELFVMDMRREEEN